MSFPGEVDDDEFVALQAALQHSAVAPPADGPAAVATEAPGDGTLPGAEPASGAKKRRRSASPVVDAPSEAEKSDGAKGRKRVARKKRTPKAKPKPVFVETPMYEMPFNGNDAYHPVLARPFGAAIEKGAAYIRYLLQPSPDVVNPPVPADDTDLMGTRKAAPSKPKISITTIRAGEKPHYPWTEGLYKTFPLYDAMDTIGVFSETEAVVLRTTVTCKALTVKMIQRQCFEAYMTYRKEQNDFPEAITHAKIHEGSNLAPTTLDDVTKGMHEVCADYTRRVLLCRSDLPITIAKLTLGPYWPTRHIRRMTSAQAEAILTFIYSVPENLFELLFRWSPLLLYIGWDTPMTWDNFLKMVWFLQLPKTAYKLMQANIDPEFVPSRRIVSGYAALTSRLSSSSSIWHAIPEAGEANDAKLADLAWLAQRGLVAVQNDTTFAVMHIAQQERAVGEALATHIDHIGEHWNVIDLSGSMATRKLASDTHGPECKVCYVVLPNAEDREYYTNGTAFYSTAAIKYVPIAATSAKGMASLDVGVPAAHVLILDAHYIGAAQWPRLIAALVAGPCPVTIVHDQLDPPSIRPSATASPIQLILEAIDPARQQRLLLPSATISKELLDIFVAARTSGNIINSRVVPVSRTVDVIPMALLPKHIKGVLDPLLPLVSGFFAETVDHAKFLHNTRRGRLTYFSHMIYIGDVMRDESTYRRYAVHGFSPRVKNHTTTENANIASLSYTMASIANSAPYNMRRMDNYVILNASGTRVACPQTDNLVPATVTSLAEHTAAYLELAVVVPSSSTTYKELYGVLKRASRVIFAMPCSEDLYIGDHIHDEAAE